MLMTTYKSLRLLGILAAACLVATGCAKEQEHNACDGVVCSHHGYCEVVGNEPLCTCDEGYEVSASGTSCGIEGGPCKDKTCSGHGECLVDMRQNTYCSCDPGFMQDPCEPMSCVPERCRETGEPCTDSSQCCGNFCLKLYVGVEEGFCTTRVCNTHEDCVNHCDDNKEMCCTNLGGESYLCIKINEGCDCGDQTGTCGSDCGCQTLTACEPGLQCFANACSSGCMTDEDCNECADPDNVDILFECSPISGGDTYCMPMNPESCASSGDCDGNEVCIAFSNSSGDGFAPSCGRIGDLDTGEVCDSQDDPNTLPDSQRCAGFYCISDHCAEVCTYETDCPENMLCAITAFRFEGGGDETLEIGLCQWSGGSQTECAGNEDCPDAEVCNHFATSPNQELVKICVDENCDVDSPTTCSPPGTEGCADDGAPPCWGALCLVYTNGDSFCSAECNTFEDCPELMDCALLPVTDTLNTGVCVPMAGGSADAGDPCIFGETHADKDDCMPGMVCLGYPVSATSPDCASDQECAGPIPETHNPVCVNGKCSGSFCSPRCDEDGQCEPGFDPANVSGLCYCVPGEPAGESGPGDACPSGSVNPDADRCQAGLSCLYFPYDETSPTCDVNEDCNEPVGEQFNPYCVDGMCTGSFCSPPCGPNDECDEGFEPVTVQGLGCQCVPAETSRKGEPCPYGTVNDTAPQCAAGLTCVGVPADGNSGTCPSDVSECTDLTVNADCVDGNCGASYCAEPCGTGDTCPAGYVTHDEGGTCYCIPEG